MFEKEITTLRRAGIRVTVLRKYEDLIDIRKDFVIGHRGYKQPFQIIVGPPGVSKSHQFENIPSTFYTNNAASAVGIYAAAYRHRDKPLIFDDVDDLFGQPAVVALFKALGADRAVKLLSWLKQNPWLAAEGIPDQFETTSRLCVLLNDFPKLSKNTLAVFDRAKTVVFVPTPPEVHQYVGGWFPQDRTTKEIFQFIGDHLTDITTPSIRWYLDALKESKLGNNWKNFVRENWKDEEPLLAIVAEVVQAYEPGVAREQAWAKRSGKSRRSFYKYQSEYKTRQGQASTVTV